MTPDRLRLLFVADGRSVHTQRWVEWFAGTGHETHVLTDDAYTGSSPPVTVHRLADLTGTTPEQALSRVKRSPAALARVRKFVAGLEPDVVHGHFLLGYGHLAWASGGRPLALTAWGSDVYLQGEVSPVARLLTRATLRSAALVTADSADLIDQVVGSGARRERTLLVSFGVDTRQFAPDPEARHAVREALGIPSAAPVILSPRSVRPIYNIVTVARAFGLVSSADREAVLVIKDYRGDPDYAGQVRSELAALGIADRVRWVEEIPHAELARLYAAADVVVSLADSDSAPVTVLEAQAVGVPVVASNLPSIAEWITPDESWRLVPPTDAGAVAVALERSLASPEEAARRAERERVAARAGHDANMRQVEDAYRRLARPARRSQ
jgi:glycosyltransferase involved in cell wall biosynthesis